MEVKIRPVREEDAEALLKIYAPYVKKTAVTFEYEIPSVEEFQNRIRRTLQRYPYLTAEADGKLLGYTYAGSFHARPAYDWAVETSIYVDQQYKGKGIGGLLYRALEQVLSAQGILNMNACIAYPPAEDEYLTMDSVNFHAHLGYRLVGQFYQCGYKFFRWYDMVWMEKHIGNHSACPAPVKNFADINSGIYKS